MVEGGAKVVVYTVVHKRENNCSQTRAGTRAAQRLGHQCTATLLFVPEAVVERGELAAFGPDAAKLRQTLVEAKNFADEETDACMGPLNIFKYGRLWGPCQRHRVMPARRDDVVVGGEVVIHGPDSDVRGLGNLPERRGTDTFAGVEGGGGLDDAPAGVNGRIGTLFHLIPAR